jgi:DNA-binding NarL/FixJ family response regulator
MDKIKIFVVDDHSIFKKGLLTQLKEFPNVEVIGEAGTGQEFLDKIETLIPDLVFMDIKMPGMTGIEATKQSVKKYPHLKIVALSMFGEEEYLQDMLDAGARGFLLKNIEKGDLEKAIKSVMEGNSFFSEELLTILASKFVNKAKSENFEQATIKLSDREIEILKLIADQKSTREIANALFISVNTVETHRKNLIKKIQVKNVVGLALYAVKHELV